MLVKINKRNFLILEVDNFEDCPKNIEEATKLAEQIGLDKDKFLSDLHSNEVAKTLKQEISDANDTTIDAISQ